MHSFTLDLNSCPTELRRGLGEIKADYPNRFTASSRAQEVIFVKDSAREQGGLSWMQSIPVPQQPPKHWDLLPATPVDNLAEELLAEAQGAK